MAKHYNKKVRVWQYKPGDLILREVLPGARKTSEGVLGPNWERSYLIHESLKNGAYHLADMDGTILPRAWNAIHLRAYYT